MSIFDKSGVRRTRGCAVCGAPASVDIRLSASLLSDDKKQIVKSVGRGRRFCRAHADSLYLECERLLDGGIS